MEEQDSRVKGCSDLGLVLIILWATGEIVGLLIERRNSSWWRENEASGEKTQCLRIKVVMEMSCADNPGWGAVCALTCAWEQRSSLCQQWQPKFCIPRALLSSFSIPFPSPLSFWLALASCKLCIYHILSLCSCKTDTQSLLAPQQPVPLGYLSRGC